jgi:hypothetical protein
VSPEIDLARHLATDDVSLGSFWGTSGEILESQFRESHELNGTREMRLEDVCGEWVVNVVFLERR